MSNENEKNGTQAIAVVPVQSVAAVGETAAMVLAERSKAMIHARHAMAIQYPRDFDVVRSKLLKECHRPGFADVGIYLKPIGAGVRGLSIRFAEAAIRCMGNVAIEAVVVLDDAEKRIVDVSVYELESNVPYSQNVTIPKTVERSSLKEGDVAIRTRTNSKGQTVYTRAATEDEMLNSQNREISKAIRNNALRLVPGDLQDECWAVMEKVQQDKDAKDPDAARLAMFDAFAAVGVSVEQVKAYLGHDGTAVTPKELSTLKGLYTAIRDGETTWKAVMESKGAADPEAEAARPTTAQTLAADLKAKRTRQPQPAAGAGGEPPDDEPPPIPGTTKEKPKTAAPAATPGGPPKRGFASF